MNFISTFDELNKLYESAKNSDKTKLKEYYDEECPDGSRYSPYPGSRPTPMSNGAPQWWKDQGGNDASWRKAQADDREFNRHRNPWEGLEDGEGKDELVEAVEDEEIEIVDDEEPKQVIIECSKCGALVIVDEVEVDEESDLVNVKDECKFCEEKEGYKIVGSVVPYADEVVEDEEDEEISEDSYEDDAVIESLLDEDDDVNGPGAPDGNREGAPEKDEGAPVKEDLADLYRKTFDKPASTKTQQAWEDELNDEMGEISDKRRKHLEKKFAQQRDWEARHLVTEATKYRDRTT